MSLLIVNGSNKYYVRITALFTFQTIIILSLFCGLKKINFSFLFSGIPLIFYSIISIILFFEISFVINYIHFKENNVRSSFYSAFLTFKVLELFFLIFLSQYIYNKYIYYIYISNALSLVILSFNLLLNGNSYKKYIIINVLIFILNNLFLFLFYKFNYFEVKFSNYIIFSILYSIFLFLFCLINYKLIISHENDKVGNYDLFSSVMIYFGIFIILFEKMGAHKINTY